MARLDDADDSARLASELEADLRRYVLGGLEDGPRLAIEERLVTDPDAFDALGIVEDELIEAYLDGSAPVADRRAFERHFLARPEGPQRLQLARALQARGTDAAIQPSRIARL